MTYTEALGLLSDVELESMKSRSWRRAASLWSEARAARSNVVTNMIANEAFSEEQFYNSLLREMSERKERREQAVHA